ncbi:MAG TPA: cation diffusion facilitator family transporter, partial [Streptosporangiaceae bacterium]|nr:cation diffusion facilitator family transporter [Streptosporangiaceae bacterium]
MSDERHGGTHSHLHPHPHPHPRRLHALGHRVGHVIRPHSHDHGTDAALEASADGWRTLWISLAGLAGTAAAQAVVVALSGSVALLGDTLHNAADALTA